MNIKKWALAAISAIVLAAVLYFIMGASGGQYAASQPSDTRSAMQQTQPVGGSQANGAAQTGGTARSASSGSASADINAAVSAIENGGQSESSQANSENGTESMTQLNSATDQSVYAE